MWQRMVVLFQFLLIFSIFSAPALAAKSLNSITEENLYHEYTRLLRHGHPIHLFVMKEEEQKILVDALWDLKFLDQYDISFFLKSIPVRNFTLKEQLRLAILHGSIDPQDSALIEQSLNETLLTQKEYAHFTLAYAQELSKLGLESSVNLAQELHPQLSEVLSKTERRVGDQSQLARDLWQHTPDLTSYMKGRYHRGIKLYMFCSTNRLYPCLMLGKDAEDRVITQADGTIWSHPALASSAQAIPSWQRNGNTPAGVHHIDGVMPQADQQLSFGKFRRLILNFVPQGNDESFTRSILPDSSRQASWWLPATVARDAGRSLLRIHGTGRINTQPQSTWFPFIRTSGCVAQRENNYQGIEYIDQRLILDTLMQAQGLRVNFDNEARIRGLFYIIEINDQRKAVTLNDLNRLGIL
jgi:hypothetical protein